MTTPGPIGSTAAAVLRSSDSAPAPTSAPAAPRDHGLDASQVAAMRLDLDRLLAGLRTRAQDGATAPQDAAEGTADASAAQMEPALQAAQQDLATDLYAFMALYQKIAQQMRTSAREQRSAELQSQVASLESAADHMVEAAQQRFNAALTSGIFQVASGAISIGSALGTMRSLSKPVAVTEIAPGADGIDGFSMLKTGPDLSPGSEFMTGLKARQDLASGSAQVLSGVGTITSGALEQQAALDDAAAKRDEAQASAAQARRDSAQEVMQSMADTIKDIRDKLAAIVQSDIETLRGIARNV